MYLGQDQVLQASNWKTNITAQGRPSGKGQHPQRTDTQVEECWNTNRQEANSLGWGQLGHVNVERWRETELKGFLQTWRLTQPRALNAEMELLKTH